MAELKKEAQIRASKFVREKLKRNLKKEIKQFKIYILKSIIVNNSQTANQNRELDTQRPRFCWKIL